MAGAACGVEARGGAADSSRSCTELGMRKRCSDCVWRQMSMPSDPRQEFHLSHLPVDFTRLFFVAVFVF